MSKTVFAVFNASHSESRRLHQPAYPAHQFPRAPADGRPLFWASITQPVDPTALLVSDIVFVFLVLTAQLDRSSLSVLAQILSIVQPSHSTMHVLHIRCWRRGSARRTPSVCHTVCMTTSLAYKLFRPYIDHGCRSFMRQFSRSVAFICAQESGNLY